MSDALPEDKFVTIWPDYPCLYDVMSVDFRNRDLLSVRHVSDGIARIKNILKYYILMSCTVSMIIRTQVYTYPLTLLITYLYNIIKYRFFYGSTNSTSINSLKLYWNLDKGDSLTLCCRSIVFESSFYCFK